MILICFLVIFILLLIIVVLLKKENKIELEEKDEVLISHEAFEFVTNFQYVLEELIFEHAENLAINEKVKLIEEKHVKEIIENYIILNFPNEKKERQ